MSYVFLSVGEMSVSDTTDMGNQVTVTSPALAARLYVIFHPAYYIIERGAW